MFVSVLVHRAIVVFEYFAGTQNEQYQILCDFDHTLEGYVW
jgi:hypothetical protein